MDFAFTYLDYKAVPEPNRMNRIRAEWRVPLFYPPLLPNILNAEENNQHWQRKFDVNHYELDSYYTMKYICFVNLIY